MPPALSIVTATYRDPDGLRRTLESLASLPGAGTDWEQIVVDSSPEANADVLASYGARTALRVLREPPRGIYAALNSGWKAATGQVVWFLNGGDLLDSPSALKQAVEVLLAEDLEMISGAARLTRQGIYQYTQAPRQGLRPLLGTNRVCQQQLLYRRDLLDRLGGFNEAFPIAADYEFHLRALAADVPQGIVEGSIVVFDRGGFSSRANAALSDFRRVHLSLAAKGLLVHPWAHAFVLHVEKARIGAIRALDVIGLGSCLRKAWHRLRRKNDERNAP